MLSSPKLQLPYIASAQSQKHVTHNEAIRALDALVQLSVASRTLATPPAVPSEGERYIIGEGATDAWENREQQLAAFQDGAWAFFAPQTGWVAWVEDETSQIVFDGTDWVETNVLNPQKDNFGGVRSYLIDPFRSICATGIPDNLAGQWTVSNASSASDVVTIDGGSPVSELGSDTFLCVEDYGTAHPRIFNQVLKTDGADVTLRNPPARDGALTLHGAHNTENGQHLTALGQEAWADFIYDYDLQRAILDETLLTIANTDYLSATPWVGTTLPVEGWKPTGGLPNNMIGYRRTRNTFHGPTEIFSAESNITAEATPQAIGQGVEATILLNAANGKLTFPVGIYSPETETTGEVRLTVDGVLLDPIPIKTSFTEISRDLFSASEISIEVVITDMAGAAFGDVIIRLGTLDILNTAGKAVSRAVPKDARVSLLMDSWGDENTSTGASFTARLRARMAADNGRGDLINRSLANSTTSYHLNILDWVLENDQPDVVLCSLGINDSNTILNGGVNQGFADITPQNHPDGQTTILGGNNIASAEEYERNIAAMRAKCLAKAVQFVFVMPFCVEGTGQTQELLNLTRPLRRLTPISGDDRYFATTHELELLAGAINQRGAFPGRRIYNVTTSEFVTKTGFAPSDNWVGSDGTVTHTPV